MNIRYVSQDLTWTEPMKEWVKSKIVEPLQRHLHSTEFELSVHLEEERKRSQQRKPNFEFWVVLQTFDGRKNEIVRRHGQVFQTLVNEVSSRLRTCVRKNHRPMRRRYLISPFKLWPNEEVTYG